MNNAYILLQLSLIKNVPISTIIFLLNHFGYQNLEALYHESPSSLQALGIKPTIASLLAQGLSSDALVEKELHDMAYHGISLVTLGDASYPDLLKHIHLPPPVLYVKGVLPSTDDCLAIVGSRQADAYGQEVIDHLIPRLCQSFVIISGGAQGADTMAHKKTIESGGKTVAILGSGLLKPYPSSNKKLFETIVEKSGAVISPFNLLADPLQYHFPERNRVIAGMSKGCVVIQAAAKSGAAITARFALTQARQVFAVPGSIFNPLSQGCHELIAQGARSVTQAGDIFEELGCEQLQTDDLPTQQLVFVPAKKDTEFQESSLERLIVKSCAQPATLDELLEITQITLIELTQHLFDFQLKGLIAQNVAGLWEKQ